MKSSAKILVIILIGIFLVQNISLIIAQGPPTPEAVNKFENGPPFPETELCLDSDHGNNPEVGGLVAYNQKDFKDFCSGNILTEYFCSNQNSKGPPTPESTNFGISNRTYNCTSYCQNKYGLTYSGSCSLSFEGFGFCNCTLAIPVKNEKDPNKYSKKNAFLISDKNWREILSLVPLTTWTSEKDSEWCQKGYGTPSKVCVYPTLIYHREGESFDADSIIYFFQQYKPDNLTIIGNTPKELDNLLIVKPELGAGLKEEQIKKISFNDYFSYWKSFNSIVVVDYDNYANGLMGSVWASLKNIPIIFVNSNNLENYKNVIDNRKIYIIGKIDSSVSDYINKNAKSSISYTLEELQKEYIEETNTDKIILVNPNDLDIAVTESFTPEKSSSSISELYSKTSLAAPILAGAKHELILSTKSTSYKEADKFIDSKITNIFNLPSESLSISLTDLLDQETFEFFVPKNENLTITFSLKDFDREKYDKVYIRNILIPSECMTKNYYIKTENGEQKETIIATLLQENIPYDEAYLTIPINLVPKKDKFNLTLEKGTCSKLLISKDKTPELNIWKKFHRKVVGYTERINNKKEIKESFLGVKPKHKIQTEVFVNNYFYYKFKYSPSVGRGDKLQFTKEREGNKLKVSIYNPKEEFIYINKLKLEPKIKNMFTLTVFSSPKAVQLSRKSGEWGRYTLREPLDPNVYADIYNNDFIDAKSGRIMGITLADVSSYIARDIFYNKLSKTTKALIMVKSVDRKCDAERLKKGFEEIWTKDLKKEFDSTVECYSYNDPELGCDTHSSEMRNEYHSSEVIFFTNHGWTEGLGGIISTNQLNYLSPSVQIVDACLTCSFDDAYSKGNLFCTNNLRRGSLSYIGADSVVVGWTTIEKYRIVVAEDTRKFLPKLFKEDKSLGDAYTEIYPKGSAFYFVLGDPTFKVRP